MRVFTISHVTFRLVTIGFMLACCLNADGQSYYDHWHFGDRAALSFAESGPTVDTNSSLQAVDQCATISDSTGQLLFYTNGFRIWNRENEVMADGDGIVSYTWPYGWWNSTTQGALILPFPDSSARYYVFSLDTWNANYMGLRYSVVDMDLDSGLGGVVPDQKGVPLLSNRLDECLMAVRHGNGRDWWLFTKRYYSYDKTFYKFLVTPDGISAVDSMTLGDPEADYTWSPIQFNHRGDAMVIGGYQIEMYDFDRCSGTLSNPRLLEADTFISTSFGLAFSPDDSKLYVTDKYHLYQYDFNNVTGDTVRHGLLNMPNYQHAMGRLRNGPDGRLYVCMFYNLWPNDVYDMFAMNLSTINFPNKNHDSCDLDTFNIWLGGRRSLVGLPNFPNYDLGPLAGSPCDTIGREDTTDVGIAEPQVSGIELFPNPTKDWIRIIASSSGEFLLYDPFGRRVANRTVHPKEAITIDVAGFPPGLYAWTWVREGRIVEGGSILVVGD